jgi:cellulose biosynthesis protein BcsQ
MDGLIEQPFPPSLGRFAIARVLLVEKIKDYFGDLLFATLIRDNISLAEAPSYGQDIFTYRSNSYGAQDYSNLCKEIMQRGELWKREHVSALTR